MEDKKRKAIEPIVQAETAPAPAKPQHKPEHQIKEEIKNNWKKTRVQVRTRYSSESKAIYVDKRGEA